MTGYLKLTDGGDGRSVWLNVEAVDLIQTMNASSHNGRKTRLCLRNGMTVMVKESAAEILKCTPERLAEIEMPMPKLQDDV